MLLGISSTAHTGDSIAGRGRSGERRRPTPPLTRFGGTLLDDATGERLGYFTAIAPAEGGGFLPARLAIGSLIELAPGDVREVRWSLVWLNDRRELLHEVAFTDGSRALLCTDVPRGSPLRFHPSRCGRWWNDTPRYAASPLDDLVGEVP